MLNATNRWPHSMLLTYEVPGTKNSLGVYSPGTITTLSLYGSVHENVGQGAVVGQDNKAVIYKWKVLCPRFESDTTIRDLNGIKLTFFGQDYAVMSLVPYRRHVEIRCRV